MPKHTETRVMPYTQAQMFDLVGDIAAYPAFLPWCAGARIRKDTALADHRLIEADLIISFKVFREHFGSRVALYDAAEDAPAHIEVAYLDGPFRYLTSSWTFLPDPSGNPGACAVCFTVDFEFKSKILQSLIGVVFYEAMQRIVRAFEDRAAALYGAKP